MKRIIIVLVLVGWSLTSLSVRGQLPSGIPGGIPSGVPSTTGATPGTTAAGGAAAPNNIWSKLCPTPAQLQAWEQALCNCPPIQMLIAMFAPVSLFTGGLFGNSFCPAINPNDLLMPTDTPQGAAAAIQQEEANAKARRAALRYLGTVDCHYWPEAEAALINGLRTDKNECCRWEAAMSLGNGCCCTKKTIEALAIVVNGSEKDHNPYENSERVKAAALIALDHCLCCYQQRVIVPEEPKEKPPAKSAQAKRVEALLPAYYVQLENTDFRQVVEDAKVTLARAKKKNYEILPTGHRTVSSILNNAGRPAEPRQLAELAVGKDGADARVPAGQKLQPVPQPAPKKPLRRSLVHLFKEAFSSAPTSDGCLRSKPPLLPAEPQQPAPRPVATQKAPAPQANAPERTSTAPASGQRGLLRIFRNAAN